MPLDAACTLEGVKTYTLVDWDRRPYESHIPGTLGGNRRSKTYGRLERPTAMRSIGEGQYVKHRVFFADEEAAIAAGYRLCGSCLRSTYRHWLANREARKVLGNAGTEPSSHD